MSRRVLALVFALALALGLGLGCACGGAGVRATPPRPRVPPATAPRAVALAAGAYHTCARLDDGAVWCWGSGAVGQTGRPAGDDQPTPARVPGVTAARSLRLTSWQTCVAQVDGREVCFGLLPLEGAAARAPGQGWRHTCELADYRVLCRGDASFSQLGDGTTTSREGEDAAPGLDDVIAIASGELHTCALRVAGEVVCWGDNRFGQLGDGTRTRRTRPTRVALPGDAGRSRRP